MYLGFLYLLLATVGLSGIGVIGESLCLQQADWRVLLLFRYFGAGCLLLLAGFIQGKRIPAGIGGCLWVGIVCEGLQASCFFHAIQNIGAPLTALILYFYPLIVLLFYKLPCPYIHVSKKFSHCKIQFIATDVQLSKRVKIQTLLSVAGPLLVSVPLLMNSDYYCITGLFFAFSTALSYGYYFSHGASYLRNISPLLGSGISCFGALFVILPMALLHSDGNWLEIAIQNKNSLILLTLCTAIPLCFLVKGMQLTSGIIAGIFFSCEPMLTAIASFFINGTKIPFLAMIGGILSLLIIVVMEFEKNRLSLKVDREAASLALENAI